MTGLGPGYFRFASVLICLHAVLALVNLSIAETIDPASAKSHWAFQPVNRPLPPAVSGKDGTIINPIDRFIIARLQEHALHLSPPASPRELIRRLSLDLLGLPPSPAEIEAFIQDTSPGAYERLVNRFLASPHYGERWGRHWLDLARYAESDGFEHDAVRPHSWRYRDYVVHSFNQDKPFDAFIREQIAGDELWPGHPEPLTATAFNLLGPDMVDSSDQEQRRHNTLNDMTDTLGLSLLGMTVGCARCHDHKFEPISQRDYYALQAFFTSAAFDREHPIPTGAEKATYEKAMREYNGQPALRELAEFEAPFRQQIFERKLAALSPEAQVAHQTPPAERNAEQSNLVLETIDRVRVTEQEISSALSSSQKKKRDALLQSVQKVQKPAPLPKSMALVDGKPAKTFVLRRGDYNQPQDEVTPAVPAVLRTSQPATSLASRSDLANWIVSADNPLTARVLVNRVWQHHFGRGLVPTPSDFGLKGGKPSHPELLDWLATQFVSSGWSLKQMHRLIVTSATYRQQSEPAEPQVTALNTDPQNILYWRMNRLRLEGEVIRDSLLAISGQLNSQMSGPSVFPPIPKELFAGATGWAASRNSAEVNRRSIYIFARRNLRFPFLEVFDAPDSNLSCPAREQSTTAPQSLTLLNSDEVMVAAAATAYKIEAESSVTDDQINSAYARILGRSPSIKELELSRDFLAHSPLAEFCRALFNLNDFVYVR